MRLKRLKLNSLTEHSAFSDPEKTPSHKNKKTPHTFSAVGGEDMEEEKCRVCGRRERMTAMLVCSHCGSFFCAPCAGGDGCCPICFGPLSRLD